MKEEILKQVKAAFLVSQHTAKPMNLIVEDLTEKIMEIIKTKSSSPVSEEIEKAPIDIEKIVADLQKLWSALEKDIDTQIDSQDYERLQYVAGDVFNTVQSLSKLFNIRFLSPDGGCEYSFDEIRRHRQFMLFTPVTAVLQSKGSEEKQK